MRFLADESVETAVVDAMRAAGHEVAAIAEVDRGAPDVRVLARAERDGALLVTNDKDFALPSCSSTPPTASCWPGFLAGGQTPRRRGWCRSSAFKARGSKGT